MMDFSGRKKHKEEEKKILENNKNNSSVYSEIQEIIKLCHHYRGEYFELFRDLHLKLNNTNENGVKEICLLEMIEIQVDEDYADLILPQLYTDLSQLIISNSSTTLIIVFLYLI